MNLLNWRDSKHLGLLFGSSAMVIASDAPLWMRISGRVLHAFIGDYVGVCDGAADDVQIQAAIDALGTYGGKIHLSAGYFYISSTIDVDQDHTWIEGEGAREKGTVLYLIDGADCHVLNITGKKVRLSFFEIDGNKGNQTDDTICGIYHNQTAGADLTTLVVYLWECRGFGLKTNGDYGFYQSLITEYCGRGLYIDGGEGNRFLNGGSYGDTKGVYITGTDATGGGKNTFTNELFYGGTPPLELATTDGNIFDACQFENYYLNSLNAANGNIFNSCVFTDSANYAFSMTASSYNVFSNCEFYDTSTQGFYVINGSSYNIWEGNIIKDVGTGANNQYYGIFIDDSGAVCTGNKIINNQIISTAANKMKAGICVNTNQTNTEMRGNTIVGHQTIGILEASTNPIIRDNIGFTTENSGTATLLNGNTTVVVAHGCDDTPTVITITWAENPTNAIGDWWVDTIGAANFTLNGVDPGASNLDFMWEAKVR